MPPTKRKRSNTKGIKKTSDENPHTPAETEKANIATFVFFKLASTGFGKENVNITEISMIAVKRDDFCRYIQPDLSDIRVLHKLNLCIKPRFPVQRHAFSETGLSDNNLQDLQPFDENTATLIRAFLSHLPKPVCLLAHSGNGCDYPLLKAEFNRENQHLPADLYIVDTLAGFRSFHLRADPDLHPNVERNQREEISCGLPNLYLYFFGNPYTGSHTSEENCRALAAVCHRERDRIVPWIDQNYSNFDNIRPRW